VLHALATLNTDFMPHIDVHFDPSLFLEVLKTCGIRGWNRLHFRLVKTGISLRTNTATTISPICAELDFSRLDVAGRDLDGIDLRYCFLAYANLSRCSLKRARFCNVARVNFEGADLQAARFEHSNLTGANFAGAKLEGAQFINPIHFFGKIPKGLPKDILDTCRDGLFL
jgi:hypothetical protein